MSEKQIREYAQHTPNCLMNSSISELFSGPAKCNCGLNEALFADPDLVELGKRWAEEAKDDILMAAVQDRLEDIILDVGAVRLTADGYEWVKEE